MGTGDPLPAVPAAAAAALLWLALSASALRHSDAEVAACKAMQESVGNATAAKCRQQLSPKHFGYNISDVSLHINVKTVYGLGEEEVLEWSGWLTILWSDPRLAWNATATGVESLMLPRESLWLPDVGFWNTKEIEVMDLRNFKFAQASVSHLGKVHLYLYTVVRFPCPVDMSMFPFDTQICTLEAGPVTSDSTEFLFTLQSEAAWEANATFYNIGEWRLDKLTQKRSTTFYSKGFYTKYTVHFHLSRKSLYYAILVIVPFELLSVLASIMFFAKDQGDRASVSIAIIMSMTLYVLIASQTAPKSMAVIPLIGLFLIAQMTILIAFTFVAILQPGSYAPEADADCDGGKFERLLRRCWRRLMRHWNVVCFASYLLVSVSNACCFLWLWPQSVAASRSALAADAR